MRGIWVRSARFVSAAMVMVGLSIDGAAAASQAEMMALCRERAHATFRLRLPDIETSYEGQRVDGTHAVNGTAYLPAGARSFQCSFSADGRRIVRWVSRPR